MAPWQWIVLIVAIGGALLALAVLADRRATRRVTGLGEPAPRRDLESVDRHVPAYITQDEIDRMPAPGTGVGGRPSHSGEGFGFGHADPDFATESGGASWRNPCFLVVDGDVTSMRELLAPLAGATDDEPLIVVAAAFHPEVLTTLAANRRALAAPVVAAIAGERDRRRLAELTGGTQLSASDLQAGYVPAEAIGHASHWASTTTKSWVVPNRD